jgi:riboflavin biosynthesis pyrimidine reductase
MAFDVGGPGTSYDLLFDDDTTDGLPLPVEFRTIYGGDWCLPPSGELPYTYINFVMSHDGRISFNQPGHEGGGDISRHARHDRWLMALLRARADAILVGATTLRLSASHRWTPQAVFSDDAAAFEALRAHEGRAPPLLVLVSRSGTLPATAAVLRAPQQPVLIATTEHGAEHARRSIAAHELIDYHVSPGGDVDLAVLARALRNKYKAATLLSEGGAQLYGGLLRAGVLNDEFLTVSPIVVGNPPPPATPRPGLIEGLAFDVARPPQVTLLSLRRHGSYLFQHSRFSAFSF